MTATRSRPGGFVGIGFAEEIAVALETLHLAEKVQHVPAIDKPRNLTLVYAAGQETAKSAGSIISATKVWCGASSADTGGWCRSCRSRHRQPDRGLQFSQGVISHLFRDIAAKRPGHLTRVGLGTFVDPRHGGKINECTKGTCPADRVDGEEFLFYRAFPINVGIIRARPPIPTATSPWKRRRSPSRRWRSPWRYATRAVWSSCRSNESPSAARSIRGSQDPPASSSTAWWWPSGASLADIFGPVRPGVQRRDSGAHGIDPADGHERAKDHRRRAALELKANSVVNLGIGMPEGVASVANEEKIADLMTLTAEPGVIGGVPAGSSISVPRPTRKPSSTSLSVRLL